MQNAECEMQNASFWKERSVLLTGATGFVGSWLAAKLVELGAKVVALVRDWRGGSNFFRLGLQRKTDIVWGDVRDQFLLERTLAGYEVSIVLHLAAEAVVGAAQQSPVSTFESNVKGTWALLEACRRVGKLESIVLASSDKAYGDHDTLPYYEDFALNPRFPYETSKACADLLARCYAHTYGLPVSITRFSNIYGGGDLNWSRIVPGVIRDVLHDRRPVIRSDGTPLRDYLHVDDAVEGYLVLARATAQCRVGSASCDVQNLSGQPFNFGSGKPVTVLELTQKIIDLSGKRHLQPDVQGKGKPLKEIQAQYVAIEKAQTLLGWQPKVSLEEGLKKTIGWYEEFFRRTEGCESNA